MYRFIIIGILVVGFVLSTLAAPSNTIYLPIVVRDGTPASVPSPTPSLTQTATGTITSTATIAPSPTPSHTATRTVTTTPSTSPTATQIPVLLLPNGDFEQGAVQWNISGSAWVSDTLDITPYGGRFVLALVYPGYDAGLGTPYIERTVTVPEDRPYLSYWLYVLPGTTNCVVDATGIGVYDPNEMNNVTYNRHYGCGVTTTGVWRHYTLDLRAHAGQERILLIDGNSEYGASAFYYDDIGWQVTP